MTPKRTIYGIAAFGALAALSFWLNRESGQDEPSAIAGLDTRLNYALQDFEALYYDQQGRLAARVTAPRLANDAETGIGTIERPRFQVVHEGHDWTILSESATVTPDRERVLFNGPVDLFGRDRSLGQDVEIRTSEVTLEVDPRVVHSDQAISILQGNSTLNAYGFRFDMTSEEFQLDSQVEGRYVLQQ